MAAVWQVNTDDAKVKLAEFANEYGYSKAMGIIPQNAQGLSANQGTVDQCHVLMIKESYGVNDSDAKSMYKDASNGGYLDSKLNFARETLNKKNKNPCTFADSRFSYSDAEKIATLWSISVTEAKAALAQKYMYGLEFDVEKELRK
jgi:hypothetical protein